MAGQDNPQTPSPQSNNQKLIIGLIVGILIGLFIAFYLLDYFPVVSTALINVLIALFLMGIFAVLAFTWFKDRILAQLFGKDFQVENSKEELKNLYGQIGQQYVSKLLEGFPKETRQTAKLATPRLLKLAIWAFTRSWALRLIVAIFVAIGGLLGAVLLYNQNQLLNGQNELLLSQNDKLDTQNLRLNLQNNLIEADRRSSLVFLMSNVLDKVDAEIALQRQVRVEDSDTTRYHLSKPLISRIVALSRAFRPYQMLQGDTLSEELVSPERGQLFVSLMENNLDSLTQNTIIESGDFSNAVIKRIELAQAQVCQANLRGANLEYANLREANLRSANLKHSNLCNADLSGARLEYANLYEANLRSANLKHSKLYDIDLRGADLREANLYNADLAHADLRSADLPRTLQNVDLMQADLRGVDLSSADLDDTYPSILDDVEDKQFKPTNLFGANLSDANLKYAKLSGMFLDSVTFRRAHLQMANLDSSSLIFSYLDNANLRGASLRGANLELANLTGANLDFVDLSGASLEYANLKETRNITFEQLKQVRILYGCRNLNSELEKLLLSEKPCLFSAEGCK